MTVECSRCKANNPSDKRFCGDCGAPLDPALTAIKDLMNATWREQVAEVLRQHYKDQKFVEIETAGAIAAKLTEWSKLFAFFVGIPVAAALLALTVLGITSYNDFSGAIGRAKTELTNQVTETKKEVSKLKAEGKELAAEYTSLREGVGPSSVRLIVEEIQLFVEHELLVCGLGLGEQLI